MKKAYTLSLIAIAIVFQYCATKQIASKPALVSKVTYVSDVEPLLVKNCSPCHFPPTGKKEPLNTYLAVKTEIDEILESIKKNPGEKGFMPVKHDKLSDSTIAVFDMWKAGGLLER